MKTRFLDIRSLTCLFLCAAEVLGTSTSAVGGDVSQDNGALSFRGLSERIEKSLKFAETNDFTKNVGRRDDAFWNAAQRVEAIGKLGDRAALPFLEEKSLMTNAPGFFRSAAALAYVRIANADDGLGLMRKLYEDASAERMDRHFINRNVLDKIRAEEKSMTPETRKKIGSFLLGFIQNVQDSGDAHDADLFLLDFIPGYADSRQRATLDRYANTGNQWVTNTFNPIKAHFDNIPPSKRVDLRDRFPGLPPLPKDAKSFYSSRTWLIWVGIVVGFAMTAFVLIRLTRASPATQMNLSRSHRDHGERSS